MRALAVIAMLACVAAAPARAKCTAPESAPELPDGLTASREEMLSAKEAVQTYGAAVKEYKDCLVNSAASGGALREAVEKMLRDAEEELRKLGNRFNAELRAFKKRGGG